jgi:hypothetical protein
MRMEHCPCKNLLLDFRAVQRPEYLSTRSAFYVLLTRRL